MATKNENSIAAEALAGIGAMYGPIRPETNSIGSNAAITVSVATMVGLPTSATASIAASRARAAVAHRPMAGDVLHHHDGVVDQDADGEDQREQADAVDRVAHDPRGEQRQQDGGGNDHQRHHRLAPADRQRDQHDDGNRGEAEMEQQLVRLVVRGLAVVAGDLDAHIGRDQPPTQTVHALQDRAGHHHGVGAGALGERQADGRRAVPLAMAIGGEVPHPALRRARADDHLRHVAHIDRPAVAGGQQQQADIRHAAQRLARRQRARHAGVAHRARDEIPVGVAHLGDQLLQGDAKQRQFLGIGFDADLFRRGADDEAGADIVHLGHFGRAVSPRGRTGPCRSSAPRPRVAATASAPRSARR